VPSTNAEEIVSDASDISSADRKFTIPIFSHAELAEAFDRLPDPLAHLKKLADFPPDVFMLVVSAARFSQVDRLAKAMPNSLRLPEVWKKFYTRLGFNFTHFPNLPSDDANSWRIRSMVISTGATKCPNCKFDLKDEQGAFYWGENGQCLFCSKNTKESLADLRCHVLDPPIKHHWDNNHFLPNAPSSDNEEEEEDNEKSNSESQQKTTDYAVQKCNKCCVIRYDKKMTAKVFKERAEMDDRSDEEFEEEDDEELFDSNEDEEDESSDLESFVVDEEDVVDEEGSFVEEEELPKKKAHATEKSKPKHSTKICFICKAAPCACTKSCVFCREKPCMCDWCETHSMRILTDSCPKCTSAPPEVLTKRNRSKN
jgi:hypothetical protein